MIGEYSATKIYFFPGQRKNCEKISPYFLLSEVENCPKLHFFGNKLSRLALANLGVKIALLGFFQMEKLTTESVDIPYRTFNVTYI